jgi:signal peptidase I
MADDKLNGRQGTWLSSTVSFVSAVLVILSIRWMLFEPFVIPSGSMIPSLLIHDHILVLKAAYGVRIPFTQHYLFEYSQPQRGDVAVFRSVENEGIIMIKRVVGMPGDKIEVTEDGLLFVNGEKIPVEPLAHPESDQGPFYKVSPEDVGGPFEHFMMYRQHLGQHDHRIMLFKEDYRMGAGKFEVPKDHYFMMGDNRDNSRDSRFWGPLPKEQLLGKALFVWLSCEETLPFISFICNPLTLRWKRFGHIIE